MIAAWHRGRWAFLVSALCVVCEPWARAHDIPNERVDRAIQAVIEPDWLRVEYEVSLTELTLVRDLRRLIETIPGADRDLLYQRYGEVTGPLNARGFLVRVDGEEQPLRFEGFDVIVEEHPRFLFRLSAWIGRASRVVLRDTNYESSEGVSRLALRAAPGVSIDGYGGKAFLHDVEERPVWMLSDAEEAATRGFEVRLRWGQTGDAGIEKSGTGLPRTTGVAGSRTGGSAGLTELLRTKHGRGWWAAWLLALLLGAAHAIQPGHGKTLVAAAALGEGGGWRAGLLVALATTVSHMGSVLLVAALLAVSRELRPAAMQVQLTHAAGFLAAAYGLWEVGRHLGGADHHRARAQSPGGELVGESGVGRWVLLGLSGGLVPCWDAVILIMLAELAGVLGFGVFLLGGFSLGMAAVLVGVGLTLGRVRGALGAGAGGGRWTRALGLASGLVVAAIGLYVWMT